MAAFRGLHREYENIRAVLGYALGAPEAPAAGPAPSAALVARWRLGAELAVRLCGYWQISGLLDEGRQWLGRVADRFPGPAAERAWALGARGRLATFRATWPGPSPTSASPSSWPWPPEAARNSPPPAATCT